MGHHQLIELALASGAPGHSDASIQGPATVSAVRRLFAQLEPLVGKIATRALYVRALQLSRVGFQRLDPADPETVETLLALLARELDAQDSVAAERSGRALLQSLVDLLVSLIGGQLTDRIVGTAWGVPARDLPSLASLPFKEEPR